MLPPNRSAAPVFVIGCPRSGTTLLYHMLLSAGDFAYYRIETHVFSTLVPRFGDLRERKNREALLALWLESDMHTRSGLAADAVRGRVDDFADGGGFLQMVMRMVASAQGVRRWAETTPAHLLYMAKIREEIPDALFVHVIRDGRDVAVSLEKQKWVDPFPWDRGRPVLAAAAFWAWTVARGRGIGARLGDAYREVHYESLVDRPHETLRELGTFLEHDLDYDRILANPVGSVAKPNTSFPGATNKFTGRWRDNVATDDAVLMEAMIAPVLADAGYATEMQREGGSATARLRAMLYAAKFGSRQLLKSRTPFARRLVDLSLFAGGINTGTDTAAEAR